MDGGTYCRRLALNVQYIDVKLRSLIQNQAESRRSTLDSNLCVAEGRYQVILYNQKPLGFFPDGVVSCKTDF